MPKEQYSFERYLNVRSAFAPSFSYDRKRLSFLTNITGVAEVLSVPIVSLLTLPLLAFLMPVWGKADFTQPLLACIRVRYLVCLGVRWDKNT